MCEREGDERERGREKVRGGGRYEIGRGEERREEKRGGEGERRGEE